jgi:hypothetical protein
MAVIAPVSQFGWLLTLYHADGTKVDLSSHTVAVTVYQPNGGVARPLTATPQEPLSSGNLLLRFPIRFQGWYVAQGLVTYPDGVEAGTSLAKLRVE